MKQEVPGNLTQTTITKNNSLEINETYELKMTASNAKGEGPETEVRIDF